MKSRRGFKIYGIIGPKEMTASDFNSKMQPILDILDDPDAEILISDEAGCATLALRYFIKRKYRKVTVYHIGAAPRDPNVVKTFKTVSNFSSYTETYEAIREKSDEIITIS
jgi:hypothetical protein